MRRSARLLLSAAAAALLAGGCARYVVYGGRKLPIDVAREECRKHFEQCAPRPTFDVRQRPDALGIRNLVHLASRLDVEDALAARAARRVRELIVTQDRALLRDLQAAEEIASVALGRCRCEVFVSELERHGLDAAIRGVLPKEQEDPAYWAGRAVRSLEAIWVLARRSAEVAVAAPPSEEATAGMDPERAEAERDLCRILHLARRTLPPEAFPSVRDIALREVVRRAGEGSAETARRLLERHAAAPSCEAAPAVR